MIGTAGEGRGRLSDELFAKYRLLSKNGRIAVTITIFAAVTGLCFAILAPDLPIYRRLGRMGVDLFLLGGVLAFVKSGEVAPEHHGAWSNARRVAVSVTAVAAIILTLLIPGIDPWLRAYRFTLGFVLLAMGFWDVGRIFPREYLKRNIAFGLLFGLMEIATVGYVMITVDGPIAYASIKAGTDSLIFRLSNEGIPGSQSIPTDPNLFIWRDGRYYAGVGLKDFLNFVHDDPMEAGKIITNVSIAHGWRLIPEMRTKSNDIYCQSLRLLNPPVDGYVVRTNQTLAVDQVMQCANNINDTTWADRTMRSAENTLSNLDERDEIAHSSWDCPTKRARMAERADLDLTLATYRRGHRRSTAADYWFQPCHPISRSMPKIR